jgi:RNA polymerase sigma factor (sigma-70 family)
MSPPPVEQLAPRLLLGTALRAQPDRRLVTLVREGYETAFEEIDRRYRQPLNRFAASIVGGRSEDVTQDALSKALLALRGSNAEIELRPWLYRIVRNTALNDLRDRPPPGEELGKAIPGARSAAAEAEGRQELRELMERLRALPEPQRAAIVMRELEGLSHEEIAAALGVSGGAARQAIYRARAALREGLGLLIPVPLVRAAIDHGGEAIGVGAGSAIAGGAVAAGGASGTAGALGGIGGGALKLGVATALIAGSVGAGVAIQHQGRGDRPEAAAASARPQGRESDRSVGIESGRDGVATAAHEAEGRGRGGRGVEGGDSSGRGGTGSGDAPRLDGSDDSGPSDSGGTGSSRHRGSGSSGEGSGGGIAESGGDGRVDGGGGNRGRGGGGSGEVESGSGSGGGGGESGSSGGGSGGSGGGGELSGDGSGSGDLNGGGSSGGSTNSGPGSGETTSSSEPSLYPAGP